MLFELTPLDLLRTIGVVLTNDGQALVIHGLLPLRLNGAPCHVFLSSLRPHGATLGLQCGGLLSELTEPFTDRAENGPPAPPPDSCVSVHDHTTGGSPHHKEHEAGCRLAPPLRTLTVHQGCEQNGQRRQILPRVAS